MNLTTCKKCGSGTDNIMEGYCDKCWKKIKPKLMQSALEKIIKKVDASKGQYVEFKDSEFPEEWFVINEVKKKITWGCCSFVKEFYIKNPNYRRTK